MAFPRPWGNPRLASLVWEDEGRAGAGGGVGVFGRGRGSEDAPSPCAHCPAGGAELHWYLLRGAWPHPAGRLPPGPPAPA